MKLGPTSGAKEVSVALPEDETEDHRAARPSRVGSECLPSGPPLDGLALIEATPPFRPQGTTENPVRQIHEAKLDMRRSSRLEKDAARKEGRSRQGQDALRKLDGVLTTGVRRTRLLRSLGARWTDGRKGPVLQVRGPAARALLEAAQKGQLPGFLSRWKVQDVQAEGPDGTLRTLVPTARVDGQPALPVRRVRALLAELAEHPKVPYALAENGCADRLEVMIAECLMRGIPPEAIQRISTLASDLSLQKVNQVQEALSSGSPEQLSEFAVPGKADPLTASVREKIGAYVPQDPECVTVVQVGDGALRIEPNGQITAGGFLPATPGDFVLWPVGHLALSLPTLGEDGVVRDRVLDPSLCDELMTPTEWREAHAGEEASVVTGGLGEKPGLRPESLNPKRRREAAERLSRYLGGTPPPDSAEQASFIAQGLTTLSESEKAEFYDVFLASMAREWRLVATSPGTDIPWREAPGTPTGMGRGSRFRTGTIFGSDPHCS